MTEKEMMLELGKNLSRIRKSRGLTQQQLAAAINMSFAGYVKYEYGRSNMPSTVLRSLVEFLNVSADEILGRVEPDDPVESMPVEDSAKKLIRVFTEESEEFRAAAIEFICRVANACEAEAAKKNPPFTVEEITPEDGVTEIVTEDGDVLTACDSETGEDLNSSSSKTAA